MIVYIYINWFDWILFFDDRICYTKKSGVTRVIKFSQRNGKLPLQRQKQGNYPVITIYDSRWFLKWIQRVIRRLNDYLNPYWIWVCTSYHRFYRHNELIKGGIKEKNRQGIYSSDFMDWACNVYSTYKVNECCNF